MKKKTLRQIIDEQFIKESKQTAAIDAEIAKSFQILAQQYQKKSQIEAQEQPQQPQQTPAQQPQAAPVQAS